MSKLLIRIKANLLVYKFIAKQFDNFFHNNIAIFRLKHNNDCISICLLMNIESVSKLIASCNEGFFCIQFHINNNLKFILFKFS